MKGGERDGGRGDGGRELGKGEGGRETGTTPGPGTYYEVRLNAWNCSCPAFTVSSFSSSTSYITSTSHTTHTTSTSHTSHTAHTNHTTTSPFHPPKTEENGKPSFGGFRRGKDERLPPICKHLLACLLSEWSGRDGVFEWGVHCRKVSRDEMAGWAGGWRE